MTTHRFPNETEAYRKARNQLLRTEAELRLQAEQVARQRRDLPLGGEVPEDYAFEERVGDSTRRVSMSRLFSEGKDHLFIYSFMFSPAMEAPCPLCSSILDALNGNAAHLGERINLFVAARSPIERITAFAGKRGWNRLHFLSTSGNTYTRDYMGEDADGNQYPMANIFVRREGRIHHFWGSELFWEPTLEGANPRHLDLMWPLWNVLDLTKEGRGKDWYPSLEIPAGN